MLHKNLLQACRLFFFGVAAVLPASAQITVNGIADKGTYNNTATFTVVTQAGFTYSATLNTNPAAVGVGVTVNRPDYYELRVIRTETATSAVVSNLLRFIVISSERGGTEWGLPPQVPWPVIQSSSNEFAGAHLRLLAPQDFPAGYEIPIVARVEDDEGHPVRANGLLSAAGHPSIQLKRGFGSGFLASSNPAGSLTYTPGVGGLTESKTINLESNVTWTSVSGVLGGSVSWPANSRILVTASLTVPAGGTLTIGDGVIVRLNSGLDITNNGTITFNGTVDRPIVFMPNSRAQPWGGFVCKTTGAGVFTGTGVIFTGSGANQSWFGANGNPGSHRVEQALFYCDGGQQINLTDAAAVYLAGQLGHSRQAGATTSIVLTRFLMQRVTTGGEYTGARFTVNDSAFIECPDDSINFVDGDNDGLYLVDGTHNFTNTMWGWTKDDGIDSGGDGVGRLHYEGCWFEGTFHEGNSLSGLKNTTAHGTVYIDCGQGLEDGYGAGSGGPTGRVDTCLFLVCQSGVRHGDNYPSIGNGYPGILAATNCILLDNHRDVFGFNWRTTGWTNAGGQMFINSNLLTAADPYFPNNSVWDPVADGPKLAAFGGRGHVGAAFAVRAGQSSLANFPDGIPVGLSMVCTNEVTVDYSVEGSDGTSLGGTLIFPAGKLRNFIPLPGSFTGVLRVALANPSNADLTGPGTLLFQNLPPSPGTVLSPLASAWKYLDNGTDQGTAWRGTNFDDTTWSVGPARLGFGPDAAATTTIRRYVSGTSGPQFTNYYFRRAILVTSNLADFATLQFRYQKDDGCVVHLNGNAIITNNMRPGPITSQSLALNNVGSAAETQQFWTNSFPATLLQPGSNLIAAEVHQSSATSSDILWEMELQGIAAARLNLSLLGTDAVLYWNDPTFVLEEADLVTGPWRLAATSSPAAFPIDGNRFFRLRR